MFTFLLIVHIIATCTWLGGAIYERIYIVGTLRKAKGTALEVPMFKLMHSTVPFFLTSVLVILITGITMTVIKSFGFFHWSWIGLKQYMMVGILIIFVFYIGPQMVKLGKQLDENLKQGNELNDVMRKQTDRIIVFVDLAHIGVLLNVVFAVMKFF